MPGCRKGAIILQREEEVNYLKKKNSKLPTKQKACKNYDINLMQI